MSGSVMFVTSILRYGGGERWMCDASAGLKARGHRVLLVSRPGSVVGQKAREAGIDCATVQMRGDLDPAAVLRLARLVRSFQPDAVCPNLDREIRLCALSVMAARKLPGGRRNGGKRKPRLIPRRGSEFPLKNNLHYRYVYTYLVNAVIANSRATKQTMLSGTPWLPEGRVVVIYNGIDTERYDQLQVRKAEARERLRSYLGLYPGASLVVLVGELNERKGHRYVIEAAGRLLDSCPGARFLFVGEGEQRTDIENRLEREGLRSHFYLMGFREDVPEILCASDVLVLPSRVEGFGYALVEAMAAGLPVVASRASSIPEIVEERETGFLHEVGDSTAIAERVGQLLRDRHLAEQMGEAGRERVKKRFGIEGMLDKLEELFFESSL